MSYTHTLRTAIKATIDAKEAGRAAGTGLWASYVRSTMLHNPPTTVDMFDARHTSLLEDLEAISPLSKEEKNSITSAKSVIKNAVQRGLDVWKRTEAGEFTFDEDGEPIPRGKSDLQDDKTLFEMLMKAAKGMEKKLLADDAEPLSEEQGTELSAAIMAVMVAAKLVKE